MKTILAGPDRTADVGQVVELGDGQADELVEGGYAEAVAAGELDDDGRADDDVAGDELVDDQVDAEEPAAAKPARKPRRPKRGG